MLIETLTFNGIENWKKINISQMVAGKKWEKTPSLLYEDIRPTRGHFRIFHPCFQPPSPPWRSVKTRGSLWAPGRPKLSGIPQHKPLGMGIWGMFQGYVEYFWRDVSFLLYSFSLDGKDGFLVQKKCKEYVHQAWNMKMMISKSSNLCLKQSSGSSQYLPFRHLTIQNLKGRVGGPLHLAIHDSQVRFFQAACTRSRPGSQAHFTITQSIYNNSTELIDQFDDSCLPFTSTGGC